MNKQRLFILLSFAIGLSASLPAVADMEQGLSNLKASAFKHHWSQPEIDAICDHLERMTEDNDAAPLTKAERMELAQQVLTHCDRPDSVKAGEHNTQMVASLESKLYEMAPSVVASTLADVATTGSFTTQNGKTVVVDKSVFRREAGTDERSFASQLFQFAVVNAHWQSQRKNPMGQKIKNCRIEFRQANNKCWHGDSRERLVVAYDDGSVETLIDQNTMRPQSDPAINNTHLKAVYESLTGHSSEEVGELIAHQNPSKFITLGEDTAFFGGNGGNGIKVGEGWMVAATNGCGSGSCARRSGSMVAANPLRPVADIAANPNN